MPTLEDYLEVEQTLKEEPVAPPRQESRLATPRTSRPTMPRGAESAPSTSLPVEHVIDLEQLAAALSGLDADIEEGEIPSTGVPSTSTQTTAPKSIVKLPIKLPLKRSGFKPSSSRPTRPSRGHTAQPGRRSRTPDRNRGRKRTRSRSTSRDRRRRTPERRPSRERRRTPPRPSTSRPADDPCVRRPTCPAPVPTG